MFAKVTDSVATNPEATVYKCAFMEEFLNASGINAPVSSAYLALKTVSLLFTTPKVGLWYERGYRGTAEHCLVEHVDPINHKSDDAESSATRK
jgi:hypothetical protein